MNAEQKQNEQRLTQFAELAWLQGWNYAYHVYELQFLPIEPLSDDEIESFLSERADYLTLSIELINSFYSSFRNGWCKCWHDLRLEHEAFCAQE